MNKIHGHVYNKYTFKFSSYAKHCHMIMIILPMGALESNHGSKHLLRSSPEYSGHINADVEVITMVLQNQAKSKECLVGQEGRPRLRLVSYISQSCSDLERV